MSIPFCVEKIQIALQLYDKQVINNKETFYDVVHLNSKGEPIEEYWNFEEINPICRAQCLMQMYDRELINKEVLIKEIL